MPTRGVEVPGVTLVRWVAVPAADGADGVDGVGVEATTVAVAAGEDVGWSLGAGARSHATKNAETTASGSRRSIAERWGA